MSPPKAVPTPPKWLSKPARAEWDRIVPVLDSLGVLTAVDGAVLEAFCSNYASAADYQRRANKAPMISTIYGAKPNPAAAEARRHWAIVKQLGAELGLSPAARTRVSAPEGDVPEEKDSAAAFLFRPRLVKDDAG